MSKQDEIAELQALLASLEDKDDDEEVVIKEGNREIRHANAALRARSYASSFRVECVECGVVCHRVQADGAHLALRDYCSINCIDDALERYREAAGVLHAIEPLLSTLRDSTKKEGHAEAWSALCALHENFLRKLPLKHLHPITDFGNTTSDGATRNTSEKDKTP